MPVWRPSRLPSTPSAADSSARLGTLGGIPVETNPNVPRNLFGMVIDSTHNAYQRKQTALNANDMLMGGGAPSVKFSTIGTTVSGVISEPPEVQQVRDFQSGEPQYWPDGKPRQQIVVTLDTDEGDRRVFVKGQMVKAIRDAVKEAGADGLEVGGQLQVTYVGDGERKGNLNPPKVYRASYGPPEPGAARMTGSMPVRPSQFSAGSYSAQGNPPF